MRSFYHVPEDVKIQVGVEFLHSVGRYFLNVYKDSEMEAGEK